MLRQTGIDDISLDVHVVSPALAYSHTQECAIKGKFFSLEEYSPPMHHRNGLS